MAGRPAVTVRSGVGEACAHHAAIADLAANSFILGQKRATIRTRKGQKRREEDEPIKRQDVRELSRHTNMACRPLHLPLVHGHISLFYSEA